MQKFCMVITHNDTVIERRCGLHSRPHAWACVQSHIASHLPELLPIPQHIIDSAVEHEYTEMQLGHRYFATVLPQEQHLL